MKTKRILSMLVVLIFAVSLAATAFMSSASTTENQTLKQQVRQFAKSKMPKLTAEQKAEIKADKAKMDAMREKWEKLTAAQKEEIYALKDKAIDAELQIVEKYLALGIIDSQTAEQMKKDFAEKKAQIREDGRMPMIGKAKGDRPGFRMRCNGEGCENPPPMPEQQAQ